MALDEKATAGSIVWPEIKVATVPLTGPYTISDAAITAGNATSVLAYVSSKNFTTYGGAKFLETVSAAPVGNQVQSAAGVLTFPAGLAGATITYRVNVSRTVESIGDTATPQEFGALTFSGLVYSTETQEPMGITVPLIQRIANPTINIEGQLTVLEISYDALVAPGKRSVFQLHNFDQVV